MLFLFAFAFIAVLVAARGGDLGRLADIRLRHRWLIAATVLAQFAVLGLFDDQLSDRVGGALHLATYGLGLAFVWLNRRLRGILVITLGGVLNLVVISANGGVMPGTAEARTFAGLEPVTEGFANSAVRDDPVLLWLGDVFAVPDGVPFANVFSIGDVILLVGGYLLVSRACEPPPPAHARPVGSRATLHSRSARATG